MCVVPNLGHSGAAGTRLCAPPRSRSILTLNAGGSLSFDACSISPLRAHYVPSPHPCRSYPSRIRCWRMSQTERCGPSPSMMHDGSTALGGLRTVDGGVLHSILQSWTRAQGEYSHGQHVQENSSRYPLKSLTCSRETVVSRTSSRRATPCYEMSAGEMAWRERRGRKEGRWWKIWQ
ncbi:hypothetical protein BC827DRAFT_353535 [Russula dissimulans]|nr:hypothetical protein BC827DRAFT_353535 [Russula dissimulans]